mmetsp:Transcript_59988/g.119025  ORF Transcript_59988/g.119025 Transcript_59988/m.119025 type:complete len:234 (-) Transcript_59988:1421-2122(-)
MRASKASTFGRQPSSKRFASRRATRLSSSLKCSKPSVGVCFLKGTSSFTASGFCIRFLRTFASISSCSSLAGRSPNACATAVVMVCVSALGWPNSSCISIWEHSGVCVSSITSADRLKMLVTFGAVFCLLAFRWACISFGVSSKMRSMRPGLRWTSKSCATRLKSMISLLVETFTNSPMLTASSCTSRLSIMQATSCATSASSSTPSAMCLSNTTHMPSKTSAMGNGSVLPLH